MRLPFTRQGREAAELRTVQVVEGVESEVADLVAALRRAGCVVESVVPLTPGTWEVTARSAD